MNKNSRIYSVPVKTAAILTSAVLFAIGVGCLEAFYWLLEEGIYEMNDVEISRFISNIAMFHGQGDFLTFIKLLVESRYLVVGLGLFSSLLYIMDITFVLSVAGYKRGEEGIKMTPLDELPFEIITIIYSVSFLVAVGFAEDAAQYSIIAGAIVSITTYSVAYFIALGFLISLVINVKAKTIFPRMLLMKSFCFLKSLIKAAFHSPKSMLKSFVYFGGILIFEFLLFLAYGYFRDFGTIWVLANVGIFLVLLYIVAGVQKLEEGGSRISLGDVDFRVEEKCLIGDLKIMARQLNKIGEGLEGAVNERMKSERFKTELITNVSHDIKTPLTSIINYTDLLKKENIESEQVKTYIDVLDRQSSRLKRLITDLIEASKASSGSLQVEFMEFDIGVMLSQAVGEYQDKIERAGLSIVTKFQEGSYIIRADGRHLWRVIDNVLNNICKYAKIDTRVYVELDKIGDKTVATFKNISHAELNVSGEELMERFVRGERARHTEGSGLGLSIAKSMMELMNGELKIHVDGDLFKVELIF